MAEICHVKTGNQITSHIGSQTHLKKNDYIALSKIGRGLWCIHTEQGTCPDIFFRFFSVVVYI